MQIDYQPTAFHEIVWVWQGRELRVQRDMFATACSFNDERRAHVMTIYIDLIIEIVSVLTTYNGFGHQNAAFSSFIHILMKYAKWRDDELEL